MRNARSSSRSVATPASPKDTRAPNEGSSVTPTTAATPAGAIAWTASPASAPPRKSHMAAYAPMWGFLGGAEAGLAVQAMAPAGVAAVVGVTEDPSFGALVSFGLAGVATDLLEDRAFRILPLTDLDVANLVRSIRAAPLLFGYRGAEPVDVPALQDVLLRVGRLADQIPEVAEVVINPVIVSAEGVSVLTGGVRVAPAVLNDDLGPRRMR